jgi:ribose transport system ATP-binding protein
MTAVAALRVEQVEKSFAGVPVLRGVSFEVAAGRTLGLIGENGAGKSTLMNILGGNVPPDAGRMWLQGKPHAPRAPQEAARAGLAFVHQELSLFPNLTIAENIFLTAFPTRARRAVIARTTLRERTAALLHQVRLERSPDTPVEGLSAGEKQLVEIARALSRAPQPIILDEPTTSLSMRETTTLFALMQRLRAEGIAIIYISHVLGDVRRVCDDLLVLRDGAVVGSGAVAEFPLERMIALMVGRSLTQLYPVRRGEWAHEGTGVPAASHDCGRERAGPAALEVRGVTEPGVVQDIGFTVRRGEVVGISGLMGAGRSELARILFGLDPCARGEVRVNGEASARATPRRRIEQGLAFLTEDRRTDGLALEASIADNIALVSLRRHARGPLGLIDRSTWRDDVRMIRASVRLTAGAGDGQAVGTLSGGNQQKVVLAKWLLARPAVLILDEPTRGVDVGAKFELYQMILDRADAGAGILVISSEIEELIGICDRILVMSQGELRGEFSRAEFDRERMLAAALPREDSAGGKQDSAFDGEERDGVPASLHNSGRTGAGTGPGSGVSIGSARPARGVRVRIARAVLQHASLLLFGLMLAVFGAMSPRFIGVSNLSNIIVQAAPAGVVAVGMTFVLLTGGVDLSVGAIMFIGAALAGKLALMGQPWWLALLAMMAAGVVAGGANAFFITRLRVAAFIVTLALLFVGRGFALWITETRAMNLPGAFLDIGATRVAGVPVPLLVFALVAAMAHFALTCTPFGRQVHAVGQHPENARKAGVPVGRILTAVYLVSGACAAVGGILTLGQLGSVSPKFGDGYEFKAIAAAVLGGTSLFGGRGAVLPGTALGAVLIQSVDNGLVILNADPYLYPLITSGVIFLVVMIDSARHTLLNRAPRLLQRNR